MFICRVGPAIRYGHQTADGTGEHYLALTLFIDKFADDLLSECQRSEEVSLERASQKFHWNLCHRATDTNGCVVDENIDVPIQGIFSVVRIKNVEFLNAKVLQAQLFSFQTQLRHLWPYLCSGDYVMSSLGETNCCQFCKSGA